jgi:ATP-dependent helicase/nuclease subunit A
MSTEQIELTPQQQAAVLAPGNVRVRAGAGSGKTEVLAHRFIALLAGDIAGAEPLSPEQIAAITFTEKATYDMRMRIAQVLESRIRGARDDALRERLSRARRLLPLARISTIHGFCSRILRENPLEARLDPGFDVLDEFDGQTFLEETCEEFLVVAVRRGDSAARHLVASCTLRGAGRGKGAMEIVMDLVRDFDRLGRPPEWLIESAARTGADVGKRFDIAACARALCTQVDELAARNDLTAAAQTAVDQLRARWRALRKAIDQIDERSDSDDFDALDELEQLLPNAASRQKEWVLAIRRRKRRTDAPGLIDLLEQAYGARRAVPRIRDAANLIAQIVVEVRTRKRAQGVVTFDDLLIVTRDTLAQSPQVLARYRNSIGALLVDEYQDTDPVQHAIVVALTQPRDGLPTPALFVVGDEKQSIYRFRGADVRVFRAPLTPAPVELPLSESRRSTPAILNFVNSLAGHVMRPGAQPPPDYRVEFTPEHMLQPHNLRTDHAHTAVEVYLMPKGDGDDALARRQVEARFIAGRLCALVSSGAQVVERKTNELRGVKWSDIAILFRAFTDVATYERALDDAGIDYYTVHGRGFFGCREIIDLMSLLGAVNDSTDEIALAAALRSPLFGVSDQCLLEIAFHLDVPRREGRPGPRTLSGLFNDKSESFEWLTVGRDDATRAQRALTALRSMRERTPVADIIERTLELTGFESVLLGQRRGRQRVANVRKLVERARAFELHGIFGFAEFVASLRQLVHDEPREAQAQILGESENVVRLMTIHQAKGLEFPVTIVVDMGRRPYRDYSNYALSRDRGLILCETVGSGHQPLPNPLLDEHRAAEQDEEDAEADRLLYVAITRARDRLVLSESDDGAWSRQVRDFIGKDRIDTFLESSAPEVPIEVAGSHLTLVRIVSPSVPSVVEARAVPSPLAPQYADLAKRRIAFSPPPDNELTTSPTALADFDRCPRQYMFRRLLMLPEGTRAGAGSGTRGSALEAGSLAHAILERLAPRLGRHIALDEIDKLVNQLAAGTSLDSASIADIARDLTRYADERERASPTETIIGRELPFFLRIADDSDFTLFIRGQIDLLAESDGALIVRDYKYARADDDPAGYEIQLRAYAVAVQEANPDRQVRTELMYLRDALKRIEVRLPSPAEIREQLRDLGSAMLDARAQSDYPKKPASSEICRQLRCGYVARCWQPS